MIGQELLNQMTSKTNWVMDRRERKYVFTTALPTPWVALKVALNQLASEAVVAGTALNETNKEKASAAAELVGADGLGAEVEVLTPPIGEPLPPEPIEKLVPELSETPIVDGEQATAPPTEEVTETPEDRTTGDT